MVSTTSPERRLRIAIIGAGPGGLCMGKRLRDLGYEDFVLLEKSDDVGGTWNLNRYPGCECDVQSAMYSFSFEIKPDWSKPYGRQPEILEYMQGVARKFGLMPHVRLRSGVERAVWSEATSSWTLTRESGETLEADVAQAADAGVVGAVGEERAAGVDADRVRIARIHDDAVSRRHAGERRENSRCTKNLLHL